MNQLDQRVTVSMHEIIYCFQMLTMHRSGGARLIARDRGGYELYLLQLRKNLGSVPQLIEYENGKIKHSGEDADLYRFAHTLTEHVRKSVQLPLTYQLDMHFDYPQHTLPGDAGNLSWTIANGGIALGKLW